jgi:type I restriction enzyme M protein
MRKSLGDKRQYIPEETIAGVVRIYSAFAEGPHCKIFDNADLGFTKVTVERPLRDEKGKARKGKARVRSPTPRNHRAVAQQPASAPVVRSRSAFRVTPGWT